MQHMASGHPQDYGAALVPPSQAAQVQRVALNLGQFTVNVTVVPGPALIFDRPAVIREIWFSADAVPSDPDGTMLVNARVRDKSEAAYDTIVSGFDTEAQLTVAHEAKKASFAAEGSENELSVEAGDTLSFQLVNNSAAITTNANIVAHILYQTLQSLD
jgi:hypothetical protein